jgi:hypothetical protein
MYSTRLFLPVLLPAFALAGFPPSSNGPWVRSCNPDSGPTIASSMFEGINHELYTEGSDTNQMIQKVCNDAASSDSGESTLDFVEFSVTYKIFKYSGSPWDFCLEAPVSVVSCLRDMRSANDPQIAIMQNCPIASGDGSKNSGVVQNPFNGPHQEYTFTITPKTAPEPQVECTTNNDLTVTSTDDSNVRLLLDAICASNACSRPREQFGCYRKMFRTGAGLMFQMKRQNWVANNFDNCQGAVVSDQCLKPGFCSRSYLRLNLFSVSRFLSLRHGLFSFS